ncbi:TspO/MBR family protein [[Mycobacterium] crassicus]|uniref:TspO/MBR family protein n=1 Tax=[Mycobacterium] crassicus TaxID=2872309 RepID=A0ABU5XKU1_9MYCO|nr:TspO/MBR family protein [Mycolicibacter sp. MYC098]MEB3022819.1 TspO/MBR family protein [Mycolicibacter sp. MYC098]
MRLATLLGTGAAVAVTAVTGAVATTPEVESDWYEQLRKPPYQPPRQVFPVVWPALYADVAVVSASTIDRLNAQGEHKKRAAYQAALLINLALNAGWSWLFFNRRRFGSSTLLSAALTASSADLTRRAVAAQGGRALPLVLYPLWCAFATVLCGHIAILNRRR